MKKILFLLLLSFLLVGMSCDKSTPPGSGSGNDSNSGGLTDLEKEAQLEKELLALFAPRTGNPAEALKKVKPLAESGNRVAQYYLGVVYYSAKPATEQSYAEAFKWFEKAANQNYAPAQSQLGVMYLRGYGVTASSTKAKEWFKLAADQGYAPAQYNLGAMYDIDKDYAKAFKWYKPAADQGLAEAQTALAYMYIVGRDKVVTQNFTEAARLCKLAADQGYKIAQYILGFLYANGAGVDKKNPEEAARLYKLAADQNYAPAQHGLGGLYASGNGVDQQSYTKAAELYRLAAVQEYAPAQYDLAVAYKDDQGVTENPKNLVIAYMWVLRAGENTPSTDTALTTKINALKTALVAPNMLSEEQVTEAEGLATKCKENNYDVNEGC